MLEMPKWVPRNSRDKNYQFRHSFPESKFLQWVVYHGEFTGTRTRRFSQISRENLIQEHKIHRKFCKAITLDDWNTKTNKEIIVLKEVYPLKL